MKEKHVPWIDNPDTGTNLVQELFKPAPKVFLLEDCTVISFPKASLIVPISSPSVFWVRILCDGLAFRPGARDGWVLNPASYDCKAIALSPSYPAIQILSENSITYTHKISLTPWLMVDLVYIVLFMTGGVRQPPIAKWAIVDRNTDLLRANQGAQHLYTNTQHPSTVYHSICFYTRFRFYCKYIPGKYVYEMYMISCHRSACMD